MVNLQNLVKHPLVQVITIYLLWQGLLLAIYRSLYRVVPGIFSPGPVGFLLPEIIPAVASLAAFWIMTRSISWRTSASFGFTLRGCITGTLIGCFLGIVGYAGCMMIFRLGGWYHATGINQNYYFSYAFLFCLFLAVAEETIFRGYIFQVLERHSGTRTALLGSSLIFGLAHVINLSGGGRWQKNHLLDWVALPIVSGFVGGLLFSAAFLLERRMWIPIGLHCAWDTGVTVFFNNSFGIHSFYQDVIDAAAFRFTGIAFWLGTLFIIAFALLLLYIANRRGSWRGSSLPLVSALLVSS